MSNKYKYLSKLLGRNVNSDKDISKYEVKVIKNALAKAWEIRNFEIQLYWKRALYFWGFIALAFYAPISILKLKQDFIVYPLFNKFFFITIICILGCFLSFVWYLANRGSKYWQENWERWINILEEYKYGKLYSTPFEQEDMTISKLGAGRFSLSRINIIISLIIIFVWGVAALFSAFNICSAHKFCMSIITLLVMFLLNLLFYYNVRGH